MPRGLPCTLVIVVLIGMTLLLCNRPTKIDARIVGEWWPALESPNWDWEGIIFNVDGSGDFVSTWENRTLFGPGVRWRIVDGRIGLTTLGEEGEPGGETLHDYALSQDEITLTITPPLHPLAAPKYHRSSLGSTH